MTYLSLSFSLNFAWIRIRNKLFRIQERVPDSQRYILNCSFLGRPQERESGLRMAGFEAFGLFDPEEQDERPEDQQEDEDDVFLSAAEILEKVGQYILKCP